MIKISKVTVDFIKKYEGKASKSALARMLHKEYPDLFKDVEYARSSIRRVTGSDGNFHRKTMATTIEWKGLSLPKPEKNDYSKVIVNEKRIGILSDIHFPYYDEGALNCAVQYLIDFKPDGIVLLGDIIDCYHLSRFEKDKRNRSFKYELDMLKNFFIELRKLFPKQKIYYVLGNHERRYESTILQNVPELVELELFNFENVIEAVKYNIQVVKGKRILKAGHLHLAHGDEFKNGIIAPVNPARGYFLKAKSNILCGHNHRTSTHLERGLDKVNGAFSIGCLADLYPHYDPNNNYNHGFATVIIDKSGAFNVDNKIIIDGKIQ